MAIEIFKLVGSIFVDDEKASKSLSNTDKKAKSVGETLAEGIKTAAKWGAAISAAAITAAVGLSKTAISAYADYEQLVGGVETLFKESSDEVIQYAQDAYKTAGLSANQYMETVTSFSASLLQSLGGDTKKASKIANQAVIDMADNANKMGTSIEAIQNAYQGFAKQNYTMLDNLKLGYGGTKEEMQRLLKDAEKLTGKKFDISNFADITEAIHAIQTQMGITGRTAKEASSTIQGSIASMKAAWTNLMTGLSDPNQDLGLLISNFVETGTTALGNIVPRIVGLMPRISEGLQQLAAQAAVLLPDLLNSMLPALIQGAVALLNGLVDSLPTIIQAIVNALPILIDGLMQIFVALVEAMPTLAPILIRGAEQVIIIVFKALPRIINALLGMLGADIDVTPIFSGVIKAFSVVKQIISDVSKNKNAVAVIKGFALGIGLVVAGIKAWNIAQAINNALMAANPVGLVVVAMGALIAAVAMIITYWDQIKEAIIVAAQWVNDKVIQPILKYLKGLWNSIVAFFDSIKEAVVGFFVSIWDSIVNAWNAVTNFFSTIANWVYDNIIVPILDFFKQLWADIVAIWQTVSGWFNDNVIQPVVGFFRGLWESVSGFFKRLWGDIVAVWRAVSVWFNDNVVQPVKNFFSSMWDGVKSGAKSAWDGIKSIFSTVADWFGDIFSKAWKKVKDVFSTGGKIFDGIKDGIVKAFTTVVNAIITGINKVVKVPFDGINWALGKLKAVEILGVKPFDWINTISVPEIPLLARGGVLERGQIGLLEGSGAEAVVPLENNRKWIRAVAQDMGHAGIGGVNDKAVSLLAEILNAIQDLAGMGVYLDKDTLVGALAGPMDKELGRIAARKARA